MLALSGGISVEQDVEGRFSLNDLHRAAGGEQRHQPRYWLALQQTTALTAEIKNSSDPRIIENSEIPLVSPIEVVTGRNGGTYVCRELVYAYAMWISPAFHLRVIRAFDAMAGGVAPRLPGRNSLAGFCEHVVMLPMAQI